MKLKLFLAAVCTLACTHLASANVTITGTGKVTYTPDRAHVSAGVSSDGKTAGDAWQKNSLAVRKMFDALKALGIDEKDVQTAGVSVNPRYVYPKDQEPRLVGYTVSYNLNVTVRKLDDLGRVLDGLVDSGANRNVAVSFSSSESEKLLDDARARAVADARKRADLYVKGAGAGLGLVQSISEGSVSPFPTYRFELAAKADKGLPISPGTQEMTVSVTITWAIAHVPGTNA
jgi:uncharacterized protein